MFEGGYLMGVDAVEGVLVAGAAAAKGGLGPAADLDARMRADDSISLFGELFFFLVSIFLCSFLNHLPTSHAMENGQGREE